MAPLSEWGLHHSFCLASIEDCSPSSRLDQASLVPQSHTKVFSLSLAGYQGETVELKENGYEYKEIALEGRHPNLMHLLILHVASWIQIH